MRRYSPWAAGALIVAAALSLGANQASAAGAKDPAGHAFMRAVERYMALRDHAIRDLPTLESSHDAEKIHAAIEARGAAIAAARPQAVTGDLFTADVEQSFRERIRAALAADGYSASEAFRVVHQESDLFRLPVLTINGPFPWDFGSVMLPCVLAALPPLPAALEYRFVHTTLVLVDVDASLVVDILPDVLVEERYASGAGRAPDAGGMVVALSIAAMHTHTASPLPPVASSALCWVLRRGDDTITTEIHVTHEHAIEVGFFPHWNLTRSVRARYDHATTALEEHARVVNQLLDTGWVVTAHLHGSPAAAA